MLAQHLGIKINRSLRICADKPESPLGSSQGVLTSFQLSTLGRSSLIGDQENFKPIDSNGSGHDRG